MLLNTSPSGQQHPIDFPWLPQPLPQTISSFLTPNIHSLQQWNLPVASISPSPDIRDKRTLPLQIPSPQCIATWPPHLFPTQGDFGRHIKKQLVTQFTRHLSSHQNERYRAVARQTLQLSPSSHLLPTDGTASNLWQCSTSLFSLTNIYELSNQALLTTTALILDIPVPHALYLQATQPNYASIDIWADTLLNKSIHAAETRHYTHTLFAQELTKIANHCGVPTTCKESRLPYRDALLTRPTRKRADMMTLTSCGVSPNAQRNFSTDTRLIMDVTIGHVYDTHHQYKSDTLQRMTNSKNVKYAQHYQSQRLAFAPIVANSLGQFGADTLQFLWNLADNHAKSTTGITLDIPHSQSHAPPSTQQDTDYRRLRGLTYHDNRLRLLTCVLEGITTRLIGQTFNLTCSPDYARWMEHTRHNWLPTLPTYDPASQDSTSGFQMDTTTSTPLSTPTLISQQSGTSSDMVIGTATTTMTLHTAQQSQSSQQSSDMELSTESSFIHNHNGFRRARDASPTDSPESLRPSQRLRVSYASSLQNGLAFNPSVPGTNLELTHNTDLRASPNPPTPLPTPPFPPPT